jgi:hypothetical protein
MRRSLFLILAATVVVTSWCQSNNASGTVSFLVVDESGRTLPGWKVTSFKNNNSEAGSQFSGLTGTQIPRGFYQYVLTRTVPFVRAGYTPTLTGKVELLQPEKFVVRTATNDVLTGMSFDRGPNSFVIRGKIEPMPSLAGNFDPLRIHIHPINPWSNVDVSVDPTGEFRIYEGLSGLCVLTVLRGEEVLHVEPVIFQNFHSASFVLRIADKPHPVLRVE